jgi:CcmD family protein
MEYLWAATGVVWLATLFYVLFILRKYNRLLREIQALEARIEELRRR